MLIDTNVFIHAQSTDQFSQECRRFLEAVETGRIRARLDPLVLHELSYALPHYVKHMTRENVGEYLLAVLTWEGIEGNRNLMVDAVTRWRSSSKLAFVDAYLAALAKELDGAVFTKNVRDFEGQGVEVPAALPP